jgi:hypothetical protein
MELLPSPTCTALKPVLPLTVKFSSPPRSVFPVPENVTLLLKPNWSSSPGTGLGTLAIVTVAPPPPKVTVFVAFPFSVTAPPGPVSETVLVAPIKSTVLPGPPRLTELVPPVLTMSTVLPPAGAGR